MADQQQQQFRQIPINPLDLQMQLTDPVWGKDVPIELKEKLTKIFKYIDDKGKEIEIQEKLWETLAFYTRDVRLGNLNPLTGELEICQEYINMAGDCLRGNFVHSFILFLSRAITILELSQSKAGFLRRRQGTYTKEEIGDTDPKKEGILKANKTRRSYDQ